MLENKVIPAVHDYVLFFNRDLKAWTITLRDIDGNYIDQIKFKNQYVAARVGNEIVAQAKGE